MALIDISIEDYSTHQQSILSDIAIAIEEKDCVGLIGLNGAGKTTLLRLLLNFTSTQKGSITVNQIPVEQPASRQDIYYLPEKFNPPDFLTGQEYLDYIVQAYKIVLAKQDRLDRYQHLAESIAFDCGALSKKISQYSKGMMQKMGIMAAVLSDRKIWVLDEPMSGLDPLARTCLREIIKAAKQEGRTIIFCTHLLNDVENLCDHLIAINQGKLAFAGTPESLLAKYKQDDIEQSFLQLINQE